MAPGLTPSCGAVQMAEFDGGGERRGAERITPAALRTRLRVFLSPPGLGDPLTSADHVLSARVEAGGAAGEGGRAGGAAAGMGRKLALRCCQRCHRPPPLDRLPSPIPECTAAPSAVR